MILFHAPSRDAAGLPPQRRLDDEAVSPVIGVVLMVAITVVLAAVVFLIVGGFAEEGEMAPQMTFKVDQTTNEVIVLRSSKGVDWFRDIALGGDCAAHATLNGAAWPTGDADAEVAAGDRIGNCASGETLTITASKPNQLLFRTEFT